MPAKRAKSKACHCAYIVLSALAAQEPNFIHDDRMAADGSPAYDDAEEESSEDGAGWNWGESGLGRDAAAAVHRLQGWSGLA